MDATTKQKKRLCRWDNARVSAAQPTSRDIEAFKLLARYPYLPINDIHAWVGGSFDGFGAHIRKLCRPPNSFLSKPHQQRHNADANYRHLIYELDDRGRQVLRERGLPCQPKKYHHNFAHELMACRIMFSFELGARQHPHIRLIQWPEILAKMPLAAQNAEEPNRVPVAFSLHGDQYTIAISADWRPFGIERRQDGKSLYCFCPGIESDTGTEPIAASGYRADIARKFAAYIAIIDRAIHSSHFGFPARGFYVPFITGSQARMENIMALLAKMTDGAGHPSFVFKTFRPFTSFQKPPPPSGDMLTTPWTRIGSPPFSFIGRS